MNFSERFKNKYRDINNLFENNRLISNIDDEGMIDGSFLMINVEQIERKYKT